MYLRKWFLFTLLSLRGEKLGKFYKRYEFEERNGIPSHTTETSLIQLLEHCYQRVPYYREIITRYGNSFYEDPKKYIRNFPVLTKEIIRNNFNELKSNDLSHHKWRYNTSGGSTGEPILIIQDLDFLDSSEALAILISKLLGREIGESEVYLWGSERDIIQGHEKWQARLVNKLTNSIFINAFHMTPNKMRTAINLLNTKKPKVIIAYAEAIYELARFSEREKLIVLPQKAIITSAGTLFPFMRDKIEQIFQCRVYNRYGSREVGFIACECPGCNGLWIPPWANYIEIVDEQGNLMPFGTEGEILVTSLKNYAMPLIRYKIGDRGALLYDQNQTNKKDSQFFKNVLGRTVEAFVTRDGTLVDGEYFTHLLYFRDWIQKFQVIQKSYDHVIFRIVQSKLNYNQNDIADITAKTKLVLGKECMADFEFVDEITPSDSGKYLYLISEIRR